MAALVLVMSRNIPELFDALRDASLHRPMQSAPVWIGALTAASVAAGRVIVGSRPPAFHIALALVWGFFAYVIALIATSLLIARTARPRTLIVSDDGLTFSGADGLPQRHSWPAVRSVCYVSDAIVIRCRHEPLFVASLAARHTSEKRRMRRLVDAHAPRGAHGSPFSSFTE